MAGMPKMKHKPIFVGVDTVKIARKSDDDVDSDATRTIKISKNITREKKPVNSRFFKSLRRKLGRKVPRPMNPQQMFGSKAIEN